MSPALDAATLDRAVGAVLGAATGDAMGAPYEFEPPDPDARCALEGGGGFGWAPGEWTDDTQMALGVLTPLATGRPDTAAVDAAFRGWFASGPVDVGNQTRAVLGAAVRKGTTGREEAIGFQVRNPDAAGNGALMRTAPVALAHLGDRAAVAELAARVAALTHPHPDSVDACVLWSLAIERATATGAPGVAFDWAGALRAGLDHLDAGRRPAWAELIDEATVAEPARWSGSNGWVIAAFQAALAAITSTPEPASPFACRHLQDGLRAAARAGGDTDTVAAIAGGLLGARWGASAVPLAWRQRLHGRRLYGQDPLRAGDLDGLARLAARSGQADSIGWPGVARLLSYYLDRYPGRPILVEVEGAAFGNVAALPAALDEGVSTVISLCRMGTGDVPGGVDHQVVGLLDTSASDNPNLGFVLADLGRIIRDTVDAGCRVFVHCVAAENRTPAAAAAYLTRRGGGRRDGRALRVRTARPRRSLRPRRRRRLRLGARRVDRRHPDGARRPDTTRYWQVGHRRRRRNVPGVVRQRAGRRRQPDPCRPRRGRPERNDRRRGGRAA